MDQIPSVNKGAGQCPAARLPSSRWRFVEWLIGLCGFVGIVGAAMVTSIHNIAVESQVDQRLFGHTAASGTLRLLIWVSLFSFSVISLMLLLFRASGKLSREVHWVMWLLSGGATCALLNCVAVGQERLIRECPAVRVYVAKWDDRRPLEEVRTLLRDLPCAAFLDGDAEGPVIVIVPAITPSLIERTVERLESAGITVDHIRRQGTSRE